MIPDVVENPDLYPRIGEISHETSQPILFQR